MILLIHSFFDIIILYFVDNFILQSYSQFVDNSVDNFTEQLDFMFF